MIDFSRLGVDSLQKSIEPRDIFMSLTQKSKEFQYPRDVQGEVWKQWYDRRNNTDNLIKMNTGSGKTVVALMILQSCLNEGVGPALYVVPDKYLVEQVMKQANMLGVKTISSEENLDYKRKKAILVVNIQKLVNGKSVFGMRDSNNYEIGSLVIDDLHACINLIQEQFSIKIPREEVDLYYGIINLFQAALEEQSAGKLEEIKENISYDNMLVPFWEWQNKQNELRNILVENRDKEFIKFKVDLIKDNLALAHCYVSAKEISIIPHCTPIHKITSFENAKRRIYMSATLPDDSPFATVLGVNFKNQNSIITPDKANDIGERLILVPKAINQELDDTEIKYAIIEKAKEYNVVVLVPSYALAKQWEQYGGEVLASSNISEGVNKIKNGSNGLYIIVNRYDGIDLPDNACRILVIDGLPNIANMNDKYEQEVVEKSSRIQREQIQRIEQGMGRGVRSNSDYCLIFLLGNQLTDMLYTDDGYELFSAATKEQFKLSEKMCEQIKGKSLSEIMEVGDYLLKRKEEWIKTCKSVTSNVEYVKYANVSDIVIAMREAYNCAEIREYERAADIINSASSKLEDKKNRGYYKQLCAEYKNFRDKSEAQKMLQSAKRDNRKVLNPIEGMQFDRQSEDIKEQAREIIEYISREKLDTSNYILRVNSILDDLKFEQETAKKFEKAIADVFCLLGFHAYQPERESGKGPDDFVIMGEGRYLVIECKNEAMTEVISKRDCNQLNGSYNWFQNLYQDKGTECVPILIHISNKFEQTCSPYQGTRIMTQRNVEYMINNIRDFAVALCQEGNFKNIGKIKELLLTYKLRAIDIKDNYTVPYKEL